MEETYISIKEFAELAGVSRQAIQQRLETSLAEFVKVNEQGRKTINTEALRLFGTEKSKVNEQGSKAKEQGTEEKGKACEQGSKAKEQGTNEGILYAALLQTVEILQGQLAAKDRQIEALYNALDNAQRAATQAQQLHAGTMQRELLEAQAEPPAAPQPQPEEKQKRGFFSRWKKDAGNG